MLPYSPLHHVLLADAGTTLVMTSGNVSDEPIAFHDEEACERLADIADLFLMHDRPIETRTDDSVVRHAEGRRTFLRRSRGYVPGALPLPVDCGRHMLACGAELKNTFALAKGGHAWVGHHVGDLKNYETLRSFVAGIDHFQRLFAVEPEVVAHDLHPEYLSTKHAVEREGVRLVGVQHHHAHLAACLAEHGETGPAVGAIFDGTGYGEDGTVWGGELLFGDLEGFERAGLLFPVRMPGGEAAIRQPWRMACAWLAAAFDEPLRPPRQLARAGRAARLGAGVASSRCSGLASPLTTSAGQALRCRCGSLRAARGGQLRGPGRGGAGGGVRSRRAARVPAAAARRRRAARDRRAPAWSAPWWATSSARVEVRDGRGALPQRARRRQRRAPARSRPSAGRPTRWSSPGGVFQNRRLLGRTASLLADAGLRVLTPERAAAERRRDRLRAARRGRRAARGGGGGPMFGLDDWVAELAHGEALAVVLAVALLLGLRHASDPDHLAAVSTLIASEPEDGTRRAGRLGLAWGLGHATTLALFGLPIVLFHAYLPDARPARRRRRWSG